MPKIFDTESDTFFSKPFPKPKPTPILISIPKFCNTESNTFFNTKFHHHHGWTYGFTSHLFYLLTVGKTIIIVIARQWVQTFSLWLYEFKMVPYFQNYEKILPHLIIVGDAADAVSVNFSAWCKFSRLNAKIYHFSECIQCTMCVIYANVSLL